MFKNRGSVYTISNSFVINFQPQAPGHGPPPGQPGGPHQPPPQGGPVRII